LTPCYLFEYFHGRPIVGSVLGHESMVGQLRGPPLAMIRWNKVLLSMKPAIYDSLHHETTSRSSSTTTSQSNSSPPSLVVGIYPYATLLGKEIYRVGGNPLS
jgi:hypothetical protein